MMLRGSSPNYGPMWVLAGSVSSSRPYSPTYYYGWALKLSTSETLDTQT